MTALVGLTLWHARLARSAAAPGLDRCSGAVAGLGLTDLCLFTDAPYTRHLSRAGFHAPFGEHPLALEHYPSGSLAAPPDLLRR